MKDIVHYIVGYLLYSQEDWGIKDFLLFSGGKSVFSMTMVNAIIGTIWNYFTKVGIMIALIYFLLELNNKMGFENGNVTLKTYIMPFMKFVMAFALLQASPNIMHNMLSFNDTFVNYISTELEDIATTAEEGGTPTSSEEGGTPTSSEEGKDKKHPIVEKIDKMGLFDLIGVLIPLILVWLISLVLNLIWIYKAISYQAELIFKISLTPLAIVDCYNTNSTAVIKWVKSVLSLVIYGGILLILSKIAMMQFVVGANQAIDDLKFFDWLIECAKGLILPFAMLGVSGVVKQVCKEALS